MTIVSHVSGNTYALTRGNNGTIPAAHASGVTLQTGWPAPSGGGGSIAVTDGTTKVSPATTLHLANATVADGGGGTAQVNPFAPLLWDPSIGQLTQPSGASVELDDYNFGSGNAYLVGGFVSGVALGASVESDGGASGHGGSAFVSGGAGVSGDVDGGDVHIQPAAGSGAGRNGLIILDGVGLPTADPHVAGALWNSTGTVKVSAG